MDKQLLKAYVKVMVEEEVKRLLPELLSEAITEIKKIKTISEQTTISSEKPKSSIDRGRLAELMGIDYDRNAGTIRMTGVNSTPTSNGVLTVKDEVGNVRQIPASSVNPEVVDALTKDYSALMKKMKIT